MKPIPTSVQELLDFHFDRGDSEEEIMDRFHNSLIVDALTRTQGNISQAAVLLKTHRNNLANWMKKYNVDAEKFRVAS